MKGGGNYEWNLGTKKEGKLGYEGYEKVIFKCITCVSFI